MAAFRIGQKVRVVRRNKGPGPYTQKHPAIFLGCVGTIVGTLARPNVGFKPENGSYSVLADGAPWPGMVDSWQLEPANYDGYKKSTWDACEWKPEVTANV